MDGIKLYRSFSRRKPLKKAVKIGTVVVALILVFLLFSIFVPQGKRGSAQVTISKGDSVLTISKRLNDLGIISNRPAFWIYAVLNGTAKNLQAGEYEFLLPISTYRVVEAISAGNELSDEVVVLMPEGFTIEQIEERLVDYNIAGSKRFEKITKVNLWEDDFIFLDSLPNSAQTLEGFLFPDTYRFKSYATTEMIVHRFLENFQVKTKEIREEVEQRGENFYDLLILASILEREVPVEDMSLAAGIFKKRMSVGMHLQADATLVYDLGRPLLRSDINSLDSPYNTYKYTGLPPTPISNPGLAALKAALNPQPSEYWYYLSRRSDGKTIFSRTLEEHNEARARYLR